MSEMIMIVVMGLGGVLFALGGTGYKWARRFVLPFAIGLILSLTGTELWRAVVVWVGLTGAFCLPYGSKTPYWLKFLVGTTFILPSLALGFTVWQIITPVAFIVMFKLSNTFKWAKDFTWKVCEFVTGTLIAVTYVVA